MGRRSVGYEVLRTYVRFAFWLTHRRIVVIGLTNIPPFKPIIFAANHQNALMDPLALACTNTHQTLWLTRADIFKNKTIRAVLKFMKMIPIYRIRDGKDNLINNQSTFNQVTRVLEQKESIALFPEAAHSGRRQMLPHKKAIPRIALDAEDKNGFNLDLKIIPVGIYYDHYWKFNRTLLVQYGEAIEVDLYKEQFEENAQNAMLSLRDAIHDRLEPLTLQINSDKYYQDFENIRMVTGEEYAKKSLISKNSVLELFYSDRALIKTLEELETANPDVFQLIRGKTEAYVNLLHKEQFDHRIVVKTEMNSFFSLLVKLTGVLISSPLLLFGVLFNFIPYYLSHKILTRKIKDPAFLSTFTFVAGLILYPFFYFLESYLVLALSGSWLITLIVLVLMPLSGKLAYNLLKSGLDLWMVLRFKTDRRKLFQYLKNQKTEIMKIIEDHSINGFPAGYVSEYNSCDSK